MADVQAFVSVSMKDSNGAPKSVTQGINSTLGTLADLAPWIAGYLPVLDAVTQDQILQCELIIPQALPSGLKSAPTSGSNNDIGALFDWNTTTPPDRFSQWYPAWITAGYDSTAPFNVLQSQTAVAALITYLSTLQGETIAISEDVHALASVFSAIKSSRSQRPALRRRHRR